VGLRTSRGRSSHKGKIAARLAAAFDVASFDVMVTRVTRARTCAASAAYVSHVLDPCGVAPRMLRSTRLIDLVNTMDPELVAAAFGMNAESVMIYLADHVDDIRLDK
jgi:hypothetical protein